MTTFTPGKYRMANGEMAIVVASLGENPLGGPSAAYPVIGYAARGYMEWTRDGKEEPLKDNSHDLVEPWTDPPTALEALIALRAKFAYPEAYSQETARVVRDADAAIAAEKARTA